MISIKKSIIKEESDSLDNKFIYPTLINIYPKIDRHEKMVDQLNKEILQDIMLFKELVEIDIEVENYACTGYTVTYNKKNIVSIVVEFSELLGIHDITYINTYNYDVSRNKKIKFSDIFKVDSNYLECISLEVQNKLNCIIEEKDSMDTEISFKEIKDFMQVCKHQNFYFDSEKVVLCFSSYELGRDFPNPIEISLEFKDYSKYLTDYIINEIWESKF